MATQTSDGGGAVTVLAFLVGALVVVAALVGWYVFAGGGAPSSGADLNLNVKVPQIEAPR